MIKGFLRRCLGALGYDIVRLPKRSAARQQPGEEAPYTENPEVSPTNLDFKLARVREGGPFELPNILALNEATASLIGPEPKRILEIGGGTGAFAWKASEDPSRTIVCLEPEVGAHEWAKQNRPRPNIEYVNRYAAPDVGRFDLVVCVDVVEHVADFPGFLDMIAALAPRALLTTPNKLTLYGPGRLAGPPGYIYHVREWTPGEFYWVLRTVYSEVMLYGMPRAEAPGVERVTVESLAGQIIADCRRPIAAR